MKIQISASVSKKVSKLAHALRYLRKHHFVIFCLTWTAFFLINVYLLKRLSESVFAYLDEGSENNIRFYRDVYTQDSWPEVETNFTRPGEIPLTAHYYWCEQKIFRFEDYVGFLSIIRILKPQKILFYYRYLPIVDRDWYHTWFQELKQSVPNLVLKRVYKNFPCGSSSVIEFGLEKISSEGGVFIGEKTILTRVPKEVRTKDFHFAFGKRDSKTGDVTRGVIYSKSGFPYAAIERKVKLIMEEKKVCLTVDEFVKYKPVHNATTKSECVTVSDSFYPKDIWNSSTSFGEFSRWLFYGKRKRLEVKPDPIDTALIPNIVHMMWLKTDNILKSNEFKFFHYLSVLSALHVAGFERVYMYGDITPYGHWWDALKTRKENVTFIKIEMPEMIFQQRVKGISHQSDILRVDALLRYGGAYQDRDVIWVNKVPEELRRYQAVVCLDWPKNGEWPEVFNLGVMMAKPGSDWLKHFTQTFSYYRDDRWAFNAIMMPYKTYELYPDTLYVDKHLQVICFRGICHPAWHKDYARDENDLRPVKTFDWREARSNHFTLPKPPSTLSSPEAVRDGKDSIAEMGRMVLRRAGRGDLLE